MTKKFEQKMEKLFESGNYDQVISTLKRTSKNKLTPFLIHLLGLAYLKKLHYNIAITHLRKSCQIEPTFERLNHLGIAYFEAGQHTKAEAILRKALAINETIDCLETLAASCMKQQKIEQTEIIINKILRLQPDNIQAITNLAVIMNAKLDYLNSIDLLKSANTKSASEKYFETLGDAYIGIENKENALKAYNHAYKFCPSLRIQNKIEKITGEFNINHQEIDTLSDAISIISNSHKNNEILKNKAYRFISEYCGSSSEYNLIATNFLGLDQWADARIYAQKALALDENAASYCILGILASRNESYALALSYFFKSLELDDKDADTYNNLALALWRSGNLEAACHNYEKAIKLRPRFVQAKSNLALVFRDLAEKTDDIRYLEHAKLITNEALLIDPNNYQAKFNLSLFSFATGHLKLATQLYDNRFFVSGETAGFREYKEPKASNLSKSKKHILLWEEQGIADTLWFSSYISPAHEYFENITIEVESRLVPSFKRCFPYAEVRENSYNRADGTYIRDFEQHLPLGNLMTFFLDHSDLKIRPYLLPNKVYYQKWQAELQKLSNGRKIIGLQWASGKRSIIRDRYYTSISDWHSLINDENYFVVSLNYHDITKEMNSENMHLFDKLYVPNFDQRNDLDQVISFISCMDAVISPSGTPGMIAAACGTPNYSYANMLDFNNFGTVHSEPYCKPGLNNNVTFFLSGGTQNVVTKILTHLDSKLKAASSSALDFAS